MEFVDPVKCAAHQVVDHFPAAIVKNQRAPVTVLALAGVFVFIQCGSVKTAQAVFVPGEMGRHPIHDDRDACLVEPVHQVAEIIRAAKPLSRCIHTDGLVTPGAIKRVLGHR